MTLIDIDIPDSTSLPPWDLTVKFRGKKYPIRQPSADELLELLAMKNRPMDVAFRYLSMLFFDLTGIDREQSPPLTLDQLCRFMTGVTEHLKKRAAKLHTERDNAAKTTKARAAAGAKLN